MITGGCSGIGLATTERFVAEGADVVVADLQDDKGRMLEHRFAGRVAYARCDVTREEQVAGAFAATTLAYGGIDIIVNNAGIAINGMLMRFTDEQWLKTLQINLNGAFFTTRAAAT